MTKQRYAFVLIFTSQSCEDSTKQKTKFIVTVILRFDDGLLDLSVSKSFSLAKDFLASWTTCTYTNLFNQVTDNSIVEVLYCRPLNTLQRE